MIRISDIVKLMPLALSLAIAIILQSLLLTSHGLADQNDHDRIVICANGELKEVSLETGQDAVDDVHKGIHCPLCTASGLLFLVEPEAEFSPVRYSVTLAFNANGRSPQHNSNKPDHPNCLDPPFRA